jgi:hypothetical protein
MRILDRERYSSFLKVYFFCFIALVGLYVAIDALINLDEFMEVSSSTLDLFGKMGRFYVSQIVACFQGGLMFGTIATASAMVAGLRISRSHVRQAGI